LIGPVFAREVRTAPRSARHYISRAVYPLALLILTATAWLVLTGTQTVRGVGDLARFGAVLFQILAPLQLALALFFTALLAVNSVAQEKDRRTLVLLLMTRLTNSELVLGKLLASMLSVLVMLASALPLFMLALLLGGVSLEQVLRCFAITLAGMFAAGSLGSLMALWREKTFQTVALTAVLLVFWVFVWEAISQGFSGERWLGIQASDWATMFSPWRAILESTRPALSGESSMLLPAGPSAFFVVFALAASLLFNAVAIWRVRVWNPSREVQRRRDRPSDEQAGQPRSAATAAATASRRQARSASRRVWDSPILWREIRTWAYGRKVLFVRVAYLALFLASAGSLVSLLQSGEPLTRGQLALPLVPLLLLSLVLVNAQAVTSITTEKDNRTLDLLLATDLTPKEFIYGKLCGAFYNTKEMLLLPICLCAYLWLENTVLLENLLYLLGGLLVMYAFVAMLGVHAGMTYRSSGNAIAVSLGTVFFLFVGVATSMRVMLAFSGTFEVQLQIFWPLILGGGIGLYFALGWRNPSRAIAIASLACPFATFFAITSFLLSYTLQVFFVVVATYGFATATMLVPAIHEFDVTTGRTAESHD